MHIQVFSEQYRAEVIELWQSCGLVVSWNDPNRDIDRKLLVSPELFLVGVLNDAIVATVMGGYDGHRGWINYLAVAPSQQRVGYGRKIIGEIERRILDLGCPKINLQIRETNSAVIAFYDSLGYVQDPVVSMGRRLIADE